VPKYIVTDTCAYREIVWRNQNGRLANCATIFFAVACDVRARAFRMAVLSELRYPTTRIAKAFSALLALLLFAFVALSSVSGYLLYQALRPQRNSSSVKLDIMMGHPETLSFQLADGTSRDGWYFPGLRGAPVVVVCHGYLSQRADVLTLVTALQDHQFNVFLFDFSGHGTSPRGTTLGYKETGELRSAIQALSARDDVDPQRFGLWGVDMGGYVALEVASTDPRVGAIAVDNAYGDPRVMMKIQVKHSGLGAIPLVYRFTDFGFRMANYSFRNEPPVTARLTQMKEIPKLFIVSNDQPDLANQMLGVFAVAPPPKQIQRDQTSYADMSDDDRKNYENQIVGFFLQSIPPAR
jgi:pimeloyl-ACP methyl ester carboxylesterase